MSILTTAGHRNSHHLMVHCTTTRTYTENSRITAAFFILNNAWVTGRCFSIQNTRQYEASQLVMENQM